MKAFRLVILTLVGALMMGAVADSASVKRASPSPKQFKGRSLAMVFFSPT